MSRRHLALATLLIACLSPWPARAQAVPYMFALTTPPATVGTCLDDLRDTSVASGETPRLRGAHLVMRTREPGGDRDMAVFVDRSGRVRTYGEMVYRFEGMSADGATSSSGEHVMAMMRATGPVEGFIGRYTTAVPAVRFRDGVSLDSAMREAQARGRSTKSGAPLSADEQRKVRALSTWLLKRCPVR